VAQGAGSLARIIGQFFAPILLLDVSAVGLYLGCAVILLVTCVLAAQKLRPAAARTAV
jgi:hypothetical protein